MPSMTTLVASLAQQRSLFVAQAPHRGPRRRRERLRAPGRGQTRGIPARPVETEASPDTAHAVPLARGTVPGSIAQQRRATTDAPACRTAALARPENFRPRASDRRRHPVVQHRPVRGPARGQAELSGVQEAILAYGFGARDAALVRLNNAQVHQGRDWQGLQPLSGATRRCSFEVAREVATRILARVEAASRQDEDVAVGVVGPPPPLPHDGGAILRTEGDPCPTNPRGAP
jgi:hypothetical protein